MWFTTVLRLSSFLAVANAAALAPSYHEEAELLGDFSPAEGYRVQRLNITAPATKGFSELSNEGFFYSIVQDEQFSRDDNNDDGTNDDDDDYKRNTECGNSAIECSINADVHAKSSVCETLVQYIGDDNEALPAKPRAICYAPKEKSRDPSDECCISWSTKAKQPTLRAALYHAAKETFEKCKDYDPRNTWGLNGLSRNTLLGGACQTQCLSNRPKKCK